MKKLTLALALLPGLALAAPQGQPARGGAQPGGSDDPGRAAQVQKRMRIARTLGLTEALDLDDASAMRVRDVLARFDDRRAPLRKQVRDNVRILRDAARGDKEALPQVEAALQRLREARNGLQNLNQEMFQQLTQGLTPEKKARAALFLARFQEREHRIFVRGLGGPGQGFHGRGGPGAMMMEEPGPGGMMRERHAMMMGDAPEPEMEEWFEEP
jgi:Heavy-metal resistance